MSWIALAFLAMAGDYAAGPFIRFPILFLIPITLASWHSGRWWRFVLAFSIPLVHTISSPSGLSRWTMLETSVNALIQIVVLSEFAFFVDRTAVQTRALAREVQVLRGLLPISSFCKKIRDEDNKTHRKW